MASTDTQVPIRGFSGLNVREDPRVIADTQLSELVNFNIERTGELKKREGFTQINTGVTLGNNPVRIIGHYLTSSFSQLIVSNGTNVYYSADGITYTLLGAYADAAWGIQYAGNFYILRSGNEIVEWDGTTATSISGSPAGTFAIIHKERMFVLNSQASGNLNSRYYYSDPGDVSATGWPGTNFIDVQPGDGDFLTVMTTIQDLLLIFKGRSTWVLQVQGLETDWVQRNINPNLGCISRYGLLLYENYVYLSTETGVYRTDGLSFTDLSEDIFPVLADRIINLTTANIDSLVMWEDKLICLLAPDASTRVYYVLHINVGGWSQWEFAGGIQPSFFLAIRTNTPQTGLYAGGLQANGKVFRYGDEVFKDAGQNYPCRLRTKQFDLESPNNMKRGKWLGIEGDGVANLNWSHEVDSDFHVESGAVTSEAPVRTIKIPGPGYFRTWLFDLEFTSSGRYTLFGFVLQVTGKRTVIKVRT